MFAPETVWLLGLVGSLGILTGSRWVTAVVAGDTTLPCTDYQGKKVGEGEQFLAKPDDYCYRCFCEGGNSVRCFAALCGGPPNCTLNDPVEVEGKCCPDYHCIILPDESPDPMNPGAPKDSDGLTKADSTNLGLRLVASTVTSFLILALLLFMIHRLRQRRMLIMMRRLHGERREEEAVAYLAQFDQVDIGITFPPYEDPPPPYSPPKPRSIPRGEAPPPYTETPTAQDQTPANGHPRSMQNGPSCSSAGSGESRSSDPRASSSGRHSNGIVDRERDPAETLPKESIEQERPRHSCISNDRYTEEVEPRNRILSSDTSDDISPSYGFAIALASMSVSPSSVSSSEQGATPLFATPRPPLRSSPEASAVRDCYNNSLSPAGIDLDKTPSPRAQFIKRSDSIEIRRQSPRNSYLAVSHSDMSDPPSHATSMQQQQQEQEPGMTQSCDTELLRRCLHGSINQTSSQSPEGDPEQSGLSWVAEGGLGMRAFRIRRQESSPCINSQRRADDVEMPDFNKQKASFKQDCNIGGSPRHSTFLPREQQHQQHQQHQQQRQDELRRSLTPLDLQSPSGRNPASSSSEEFSPISSDHYSSGNNNASEVSSDVLEQASGEAPVQDCHGNGALLSPASSQSTPSSPLARPVLLRSGSVMSQVSQFSVCSETGESKRPLYHGNHNTNASSIARQRSLRNDVQYPLLPPTSNLSAPVLNSLSANRVPDSRNSGCCASSSSATPSPSSVPRLPAPPTASSGSVPRKQSTDARNRARDDTPVQDRGSALRNTDPPYRSPDPRTYRKIIYRDPDDVYFSDEDRDRPRVHQTQSRTPGKDSTAARGTSNSPRGKRTNQKDSSKDNQKDRAMSNQNPESNTSVTANSTPHKAERITLRKLKQKKRPTSTPGPVPDNKGGDEEKTRNRKSLDSPSRLRRPSKGESTKYKEYGFIDNPTALMATSGSNPTSRSNSLKRRDSKEKRKRSRSGERQSQGRTPPKETNGNITNGFTTTENGIHRRESSGSRSRSRSRERSSSRHKKENRERGQTSSQRVSRHDNRESPKADNTAEASPKKRHHKSRSPGRRKRRSTGHRYDNMLNLTNGHSSTQAVDPAGSPRCREGEEAIRTTDKGVNVNIPKASKRNIGEEGMQVDR